MLPGFGRHVPAALLEEYSIGRLRESGMALVEEHLLVCSRCRRRLVRIDEFVRACRTACLRLKDRPGAFSPGFRRLLDNLRLPASS